VSKISASRRTIGTAVGAAAVILFCSARIDAASTELFRIERNTNANYVRYDARIRDDGSLDPRAPVSAYWVLPGEKGRREGLSWLEEKLAYGFSVTRTHDGYALALTAFDERKLALRRGESSWRAEVIIAGKHAVLQKIWVQVSGTVLGPHVDWVELHGRDTRSKDRISERIVNQ
jgi:hypothetical protein